MYTSSNRFYRWQALFLHPPGRDADVYHHLFFKTLGENQTTQPWKTYETLNLALQWLKEANPDTDGQFSYDPVTQSWESRGELAEWYHSGRWIKNPVVLQYQLQGKGI